MLKEFHFMSDNMFWQFKKKRCHELEQVSPGDIVENSFIPGKYCVLVDHALDSSLLVKKSNIEKNYEKPLSAFSTTMALSRVSLECMFDDFTFLFFSFLFFSFLFFSFLFFSFLFQASQPSMGGTEAFHAVRSLHLSYPKSGSRFPCNVFMISDGHLAEEQMLMSAIKQSSRQVRVFTFGVG